jgi:multidrug efflux pump subunit AcrB
MYLMGFTLNVVTLLSLSLVVGILVDDAIVEIENIMRHLRMGKTPYQAAMEAADEIGLAVIATTFTLIAVFLPTAFMSGVPGKFFVQFGWTAAIAVFFSLVVARMLTPMMAAYILRPPQERARRSALAGKVYMRLGRLVPEAPAEDDWAPPSISSSAPSRLVPLLSTGFMPPDDLSQTQVYALRCSRAAPSRRPTPPPKQARRIVETNPHVKMVYTAIGGGATGSDPFAHAAPPRRARRR